MGNNSFAQAARARKTLRMVEYFDREMIRVGIDPFADAEVMVGMLREQTSDAEWRKHALVAGQHPPSVETKAATIESNKVTPIRRFGGMH